MSEIKNVGQTWMALNTFKRNRLIPLQFEWLSLDTCKQRYRVSVTFDL